MDVQESQLRMLSSPNAILEKLYGVEPEYLWGTIERIEADDLTVTKLEWVLHREFTLQSLIFLV
jgi:hypothetical protein